MNTSLKNKLLVCDLDGTLLDAQGQIDEKSLTLIKEFCAAGGHFVVCTGRMDTDIQFIEEKLGVKSEYRISQNGAVIYDKKNQLVASATIPLDYIKALNEVIFSQGLRTEVSNLTNRLFPSPRDPENVAEFVDSSIVIEDLPTFVAEKEKQPTIYLTFGTKKEFEVIHQKIEETLGKDKVNIVMTSPSSLEVFSNKVSKGAAVQRVIEWLGLGKDQVYVAGDAESDTSMFPLTPNSYAVQEATAEIRAKAMFYSSNVGEIVKDIFQQTKGAN